MLIGREKELGDLKDLLKPALQTDADPLSIYIGGTPGTGKTASVKHTIERLSANKDLNFKFFTIDCFEITSAVELYRRILGQLIDGPMPQSTKLLGHLRKMLKNVDNKIVILLDEIDRLSKSKTDTLICNAFGWPEYTHGNVILIGISNSLDLVDRVMPKLRASQFPPKVLTFAPYTKDQLIRILEAKMSKDGTDGTAIELCARKVSALTGDVRRAFHIANGVLESIKEEMANAENIPSSLACVTSTGESPKKKNACRYVLKELDKIYASPLLRAQLPLHPRILLATFMRLIASGPTSGKRITASRTVVQRDKLLDAYWKVCDVLKYTALDSEELSNAFSVLESQGVIASKAKGRVAFEVEMEIARRVVNDNAILSAIEIVEF